MLRFDAHMDRTTSTISKMDFIMSNEIHLFQYKKISIKNYCPIL